MKNLITQFLLSFCINTTIIGMHPTAWQQSRNVGYTAASWIRQTIKDLFVQPSTPTITGKELNDALKEHISVQHRLVYGHMAPRIMVGLGGLIAYIATKNIIPKKYKFIASLGALAGSTLAIWTLIKTGLNGIYPEKLKAHTNALKYFRKQIRPQSNPRLVLTSRKVSEDDSSGNNVDLTLHTIQGEWDGTEKKLQGITYYSHPNPRIQIKGYQPIYYGTKQ